MWKYASLRPSGLAGIWNKLYLEVECLLNYGSNCIGSGVPVEIWKKLYLEVE